MVSRIIRIFRRREADPDCHEVRELSSDYIEEELGQEAMSRVRQHLSKCPPCNSFIKTLRATLEMLRAMPRQEAPDGFKERIHRNIHNIQNP